MALHLALGLGPVGAAGSGAKAIVAGERKQAGMEAGALSRVGQHRLFLVVVEDLLGHPSEEGESAHVKRQKRLQLGRRHHLGVKGPGVAEHHGEEVERSNCAGKLVTPQKGPVDLGLMSGWGLKADDGLPAFAS